jgi:hypothetical protein
LATPDQGSLALARLVVPTKAVQKRAVRLYLATLLARPRQKSVLVLQPLVHHHGQESALVLQPHRRQTVLLAMPRMPAAQQIADRGWPVAGGVRLAEQIGAHLAQE